VAVGVALRLVAFLKNPPLGLDEARLALNLGVRSYRGLVGSLAFDQSAPLLYLWLERAVSVVLGMHDWALRLLPLVAGMGLVLLNPRVFARVLGPGATLAATAVAACSPLLIQYTVSVKQYGVEACLTLLVLGLALETRGASWGGRAATRLTVIGAVLPWLMAPAAFALSGIVACALVDLRHGHEAARRFLLRSVPGWALSSVMAYLVVYRPASMNPYLHRYWSTAFLSPIGEGLRSRLWVILNENVWGLALGYPGPPGLHPTPAGIVAICVVLLIVLAGCRALGRGHGWSILVLVTVPLLATLGASVAGVYPLGLRLTLFAMPLVQLLLFAGLDFTLTKLSSTAVSWAWVGGGSALALPLAAVTLLLVGRPDAAEDVRTLVRDLSVRRHGERVYVFARSIPPWAFYTTDWGNPDRRRLAFLSRVASSEGPAFENAPSGAAAEDEAHGGLEYSTAAGVEMYGRPTGVEWTPNLGPLTLVPDPGWAEREADRIWSASGPVWVLMSRTLDGERRLVSTVERRGACATYVRELDNAALIRYVPSPALAPGQCKSAARR